MATRDQTMAIAKREVGTKESPAGSNNVKYGAWYGLNHNPWCAMFVSWVLHTAGIAFAVQTAKGFAYCPSGVSWFKSRGRLINSRQSKPGDVVFFNFNGGSIAEHVGLVLENNAWKSTIKTVEGNTGAGSQANGGEVQIRERDRSLIVAVGDMSNFYKNVPHPEPAKWQDDNGKVGHPQLGAGTKGAAVKHLQTLLLHHSQNIVVDGVFGSHTTQCVKNFQQGHGLSVDGVAGPRTWEALHR